MRDIMVTLALIWLAIGALIFEFIVRIGVVERSLLARGSSVSKRHAVLGCLLAILWWPGIARKIMANPKAAGARLKQILWGNAS
jgi:hypothetical protein